MKGHLELGARSPFKLKNKKPVSNKLYHMVEVQYWHILIIHFNPKQAGGGEFGAPPSSFFALALSFLTLSQWNFFTFNK